MALDPVCMMDIEAETPEANSEYEGETIYFCSEECKRTAGDRARQEP